MNKVYIYINPDSSDNSYKLAFLAILRYYMIKNKYINNFNVKTIFSLNNINDNAIVIPIGVECNYELFKNKYNFNVGNMLDDKILFYKYLEKNDDLLGNIKIIKSYNYHKCENILKEFYIKPKDGKGKNDHHVEKDYITNIFKKYDKNIYQIQDNVNIKHNYAVNCSCIDGNIIGLFVSTYGLTDFSKKYKRRVKDNIDNNEIKNCVLKILQKIKYNGLIEFEFIFDENNNIYLMECNPRMTGFIFIKEYFDILIIPYIKYQKNKYYKPVQSKGLNKMIYLDNVYVNCIKFIILLIYEIIKINILKDLVCYKLKYF